MFTRREAIKALQSLAGRSAGDVLVRYGVTRHPFESAESWTRRMMMALAAERHQGTRKGYECAALAAHPAVQFARLDEIGPGVGVLTVTVAAGFWCWITRRKHRARRAVEATLARTKSAGVAIEVDVLPAYG